MKHIYCTRSSIRWMYCLLSPLPSPLMLPHKRTQRENWSHWLGNWMWPRIKEGLPVKTQSLTTVTIHKQQDIRSKPEHSSSLREQVCDHGGRAEHEWLDTLWMSRAWVSKFDVATCFISALLCSCKLKNSHFVMHHQRLSIRRALRLVNVCRPWQTE